MTATHNSTAGRQASGSPPHMSSAIASANNPPKRRISAHERWVLISHDVYARAQKRGFVGGDLRADLAEVTREIDRKYETDIKSLLSLTEAGEMVEQFKELFASCGLRQRAIDRLLELSGEALESLAKTNRDLIDAPPYTKEQLVRLQNTAGAVVESLQSFSQGLNADEVSNRLDAPIRTVQTLLSGLHRLMNPMGHPATPTPRTPDSEFLRGATIKAHHAKTAAELADAPVAALKGLSQETGLKLESAFGIRSIGDLATCRMVERAVSIAVLADAQLEALGKEDADPGEVGPGVIAIADGPITGIDGVTPRQAQLLKELLGVETARDLARNRFVRLAQAILALAGTQDEE
ncbi:MAG: hypothetical protein PVJ33_00610 [Lysobacterales bacterium]